MKNEKLSFNKKINFKMPYTYFWTYIQRVLGFIINQTNWLIMIIYIFLYILFRDFIKEK